jgi:3-oxoacyl-[acyl-carrier protein] reductase
MDGFNERVAIVTGAGRGIGRATALKLSREGARLVVNDLDAAESSAVAAEIQAFGGEAVSVPGDVTHPDLGTELVAAAVDSYSTLDIVVNNAGWVEVAPIRDVNDARWQRMMSINLDASFRLLRAAGAVLIEEFKRDQAAGRLRQRKIVNVSSRAGTDGTAGSIHYGAAKAGVIGMTKSAAKEWGRFAINVNAVAFGIIDTRLTLPGGDPSGADSPSTLVVTSFNKDLYERGVQATSLRRAGTPDEGAGVIRFLCSADADYVSGQVVLCAGG